MIFELIILLYTANTIFIICHQIDAAYWKEWDLFSGRSGIPTEKQREYRSLARYIAFSLVALAIIFFGMYEISRYGGLSILFSMIMALVGITTFSIHAYFFRKGKKEFKAPISLFVLYAILAISITELVAVK